MFWIVWWELLFCYPLCCRVIHDCVTESDKAKQWCCWRGTVCGPSCLKYFCIVCIGRHKLFVKNNGLTSPMRRLTIACFIVCQVSVEKCEIGGLSQNTGIRLPAKFQRVLFVGYFETKTSRKLIIKGKPQQNHGRMLNVIFKKWISLLLSTEKVHTGSSNGKMSRFPWHDRMRWRLEEKVNDY